MFVSGSIRATIPSPSAHTDPKPAPRVNDSQPSWSIERITRGIFAMVLPCRSIRHTVPSCRDCTQIEPNAATTAPGFGTSIVRFAVGSGEGGGSVDGGTDVGGTALAETVAAGGVVVDDAALHPASANARHMSAASRTIRQR